MIRRVIEVLKRHLDEAYEELEQWEAIEVTPWDVLREYPDYHQLRRLSLELIGVIRGVDVANLIQVPKFDETKKFLESIYPQGLEGVDEDMVIHQTKELRMWLAGYRHNFNSPPRVILDTRR